MSTSLQRAPATVRTRVGEEKLQDSPTAGTLAVDLGSTTTVVAFAAVGERSTTLLNLDPISVRAGEVPSLLWQTDGLPLIGREVLEAGLADQDDPRLAIDFKRQIGSDSDDGERAALAGTQLLKGIWAHLPNNIAVERLVLTAPVETYRSYRRWLL